MTAAEDNVLSTPHVLIAKFAFFWVFLDAFFEDAIVVVVVVVVVVVAFLLE